MKKKILVINGHLNAGGVEKSLLDILTHLDYDVYDVDLLLTEEYGDYMPQIPAQVNIILRSLKGTYGSFLNVMVKSIKNHDWFSMKMRIILQMMRCFGCEKIAWARNLLTGKQEYDCVIGFRRGICTEIATYAVKAKRRIGWWHHGTVNVNTEVYLREIEKCDQIVAVSEGCKEMLIRAIPLLEKRLVTIPNILDPERIRQKSDGFVPYEKETCIHIVSVGRLSPEKHFDDAVSVAKELKERGIPFRWHLVGDGPMREELEQMIRRMNVEDCFVLEGNQVNPYPYMKHADLFVHPSYVESFGIVVTEALALGIPCVVTKSTGIMDFLVDGENAVLTEQNLCSLTDKVIEMVENTELREYIRQNSCPPKDFLPDQVMKKIDKLLEK